VQLREGQLPVKYLLTFNIYTRI